MAREVGRARVRIAGLIALGTLLASAAPTLAAGSESSVPYLGQPLDRVMALNSPSTEYEPTVTDVLPTMVALRALADPVNAGRMSMRTAERLAIRRAGARRARGGNVPPLHCQPAITHATGKITKTTDGRPLPSPLYVAHAGGHLRCWLVVDPTATITNPPAPIQAAGGSAIQSGELPKPKTRYRIGKGYDKVNSAFHTTVKYAYTQKSRIFRFFWFAYENIVPRPYRWIAAGFGRGAGIKEEHCKIESSDNRDMSCIEISHQFAYNGR